MGVKYEIKNGVLTAHINPEHDLEDIQEVAKIVENHGEVILIRVDMHRCSYIQSRFLAGLVSVKKLAMVRKITIELLNVNDHIIQVLQSTNLQKLFVLKDDYSSYPLEALCEKFYDTAIISNNDIIIPSKNQINFWSDKVKNIKMLESGHFPFYNFKSWDEILKCK